jgi:hypothetical protein
MDGWVKAVLRIAYSKQKNLSGGVAELANAYVVLP